MSPELRAELHKDKQDKTNVAITFSKTSEGEYLVWKYLLHLEGRTVELQRLSWLL